ncbi:hypothetical protein EV421DRAFT_1782847 [Armillaria borealis]|uniref:GmrSD restriction endonucleases N-terminal domain-containing protein n=1 Tax=Armillaria borealis TaxID=47425 RepID=A0AA39JTA5_9AGAR|nr:hypothetical protein EV421DRAFT_1782847 [Armillaria borealis]
MALTDEAEGSYYSDSGDVAPTASSSKPTSKPVKRESDEYRLSNALKVPRATTYTAQALYEQILSNDIDLDPEYQRGEVWRENKQTGLIDSIFRNFYIPPVIFAVNLFDDGTETRTCIDGKQRLTSIHRFMDGLVPHRDHDTGRKYWYRDHPGIPSSKQKNILPETLRRLFANKQIVCVEYSDLTDDGERDIFQRVQLGMALTAAEKLQAISSPRVQIIRELLVTHPLDNIPFDRSRATDFRCFVTLAHALTNYPDINNILIEPAQLTKWLKSEGEGEGFRTKMEETLVRMAEVSVPDKGKEKVSPIEVVFIGVLANAVSDGRDLSDLVAEMRSDARAAFKRSMRLNSQVGKHMMAFVKRVDPSRKRGRELEEQEEKPKKRRAIAESGKKSRAQQQMEEYQESKERIRLIKEGTTSNPQRLPSPMVI